MPNTAIFIGTALQKKIFKAIRNDLLNHTSLSPPLAVLLDNFYRFGIRLDNYPAKLNLKCPISRPWYDQPPILKLISLVPFILQILSLSRKCKNFIFFVDTGILERTAIKIFNRLGRRTIVIQDALKRIPKNKNTKKLTWFGGANASIYFLTGYRYAPMVTNNRFVVVGSPIYKNDIQNVPLGNKILVINQCFARYGEMNANDEVAFMEHIVKTASDYGPVELRLHPHNDIKMYKKLETCCIQVTQRRSLFHSLKEAGIVIGVNSTVLLEAMTMIRPIIALDWHPSPFFNPLSIGIIHCQNINDMCVTLENWKNGRKLVNNSEFEYNKEILSHIAFSGQESVEKIIANLSKYS